MRFNSVGDFTTEAKGADVTLTFNANGTVAYSGKVDGTKVSDTSTLAVDGDSGTECGGRLADFVLRAEAPTPGWHVDEDTGALVCDTVLRMGRRIRGWE